MSGLPMWRLWEMAASPPPHGAGALNSSEKPATSDREKHGPGFAESVSRREAAPRAVLGSLVYDGWPDSPLARRECRYARKAGQAGKITGVGCDLRWGCRTGLTL